jgi:hypothetical protein
MLSLRIEVNDGYASRSEISPFLTEVGMEGVKLSLKMASGLDLEDNVGSSSISV